MTIGLARRALAGRIAAILTAYGKTYPVQKKRGHDDPDPRIPDVHLQYTPILNDDKPDAPCVIVRVMQWSQNGDTRTARAQVLPLLYCPDGEQGYQDVENLLQVIELELIREPWLDQGTFHLLGPWESGLADVSEEYFGGTLEFVIVIPAILEDSGPQGESLSDVI